MTLVATKGAEVTDIAKRLMEIYVNRGSEKKTSSSYRARSREGTR